MTPGRAASRIAYLVHDLTDPAVDRRVKMLQAGGAAVSLAGFRRSGTPPSVDAVCLGRTFDANMGQRLTAVARRLLTPWRLTRLAHGQDVVLARTLEMLLLAWVARLPGRRRTRLVYECLDIHRLMLGRSLASRTLRRIEGALLARTDMVLVSSPAFEREYFDRYHPGHPPILLVENKLAALEPRDLAVQEPRRAGPWRIGWFGMIRCRQSLDLLAELAAALPGQVEVVIRGRPSPAVFEEFPATVGKLPGVRFEGPYAVSELSHHYGEIDFVWTIDYYEEGLNSSWLLPNRLYEGGAFDRPALAQASVETARWLQARRSGVILDDPRRDLIPCFRSMTRSHHSGLVDAARRVPRSDLISTRQEGRDLVDRLCRRGSP